ncbi:MAG TPA: hypothetical protein VFI29_23015, partial [Hanamia sp.]|nr:hypothetical protein [Hanamia sp.]
MRRKEFLKPFIGIKQEIPGFNVVYSSTGSLSIIMRIFNLCPQYGADAENYENYHMLFGQIIKLLGDGYTLQKTDIIASQKYSKDIDGLEDYLSKKYFEHFEGRIYKEITTYLIITKESAKGHFFSFDAKALKEFLDKAGKVVDTIKNQKITCTLLSKQEIETLYKRYIAFNFSDKQFAIGNLSCDEKGVYYEDKSLKSISLIDIDEINLPSNVTTFTVSQETGKTFPVDNLAFLLNVNADTILYNQVI